MVELTVDQLVHGGRAPPLQPAVPRRRGDRGGGVRHSDSDRCFRRRRRVPLGRRRSRTEQPDGGEGEEQQCSRGAREGPPEPERAVATAAAAMGPIRGPMPMPMPASSSSSYSYSVSVRPGGPVRHCGVIARIYLGRFHARGVSCLSIYCTTDKRELTGSN